MGAPRHDRLSPGPTHQGARPDQRGARPSHPPLSDSWFFDNGAFRAWSRREPFDEHAFERDVARIRREGLTPDFVVAPDVVGGGLTSLAFSLSWVDRLAGLRVYLAVQDGMEPEHVAPHIGRFDGVFVGGTLEWKLRTGVSWVDFAHAHGKPCHVGRVGTASRVEWARAIGVDSIDSSLPLWSVEKFEAFMGALRSEQIRMWA